MPASQVEAIPGRWITLKGKEYTITTFQRYAVLFWREGDLVYCLVSDLGEEKMVAFASTYIR